MDRLLEAACARADITVGYGRSLVKAVLVRWPTAITPESAADLRHREISWLQDDGVRLGTPHQDSGWREPVLSFAPREHRWPGRGVEDTVTGRCGILHTIVSNTDQTVS
ncbi:hypothetical protein [Streptomyces sp. NPDC055632]